MRLSPRWHISLALALTLCLPLVAHAGDSTEVQVSKALSEEFTYAYLGGGVLLPLLDDDSAAGRQQALRTADSLGVSVVTCELLKRGFNMQRPDGRGNDSFPSGHATAAFSVATMQAHYHPGDAVYWYAGAAAISYSRVRLNRHRVEDVLAGAALGYGLSRLELQLPHGYVLRPWIDDEADGLYVSCSF